MLLANNPSVSLAAGSSVLSEMPRPHAAFTLCILVRLHSLEQEVFVCGSAAPFAPSAHKSMFLETSIPKNAKILNLRGFTCVFS
jgi:hypothetical protein